MKNKHLYTLNLKWKGDKNQNSTKNDRKYEVKIEGKPSFLGSADAAFHGDSSLYNPEDLLLSALSACQMMSYFYVCRREGIQILSYQDNPEGILKVYPNGSGQFELVTLKPKIELVDSNQKSRAIELHKEAGKLCFIANSVNFEIKYEIEIN